jgi:cytochrome c oxidase assembly protein subunit 15
MKINLNRVFLNFLRLGCLLALVVIILGAYVRLSDAGLGCPDWPGCYGKLIVPEGSISQVEEMNLAYPERLFEKDKAWKEMLHRYLASALGFLILMLAALTWFKPQFLSVRLFSSILLALVMFQGLLGMWTVTLLLKPVVVMLHLLGGLTILSLLYWKMLQQQSSGGFFVSESSTELFPIVVTALFILFCQISLGGWTSSNYAALACPDFPTCQNMWWPEMNFKEGFTLWQGLGIDYEGGTLNSEARTAIHMTHRIGAIITGVIISYVSFQAILTGTKYLRLTGVVVLIVLITQLSLGVANIKFNLPLSIAVAHNGVAALLLLSLITLLHHCVSDRK